ncbi:sulfur carrier protein ThiS [Natronospira bacteriovora]|uniref:Sulfur carrier protein ThiS n=1 Tax=Natronospira bacteriovora TaxID=3069753 RepID=A0ABU0W987_9GAMM|nr:sulfur carrier protein ThiS [Natronospira sp. AB-CW4]MDQ2070609.1 sulfur carrier protein ThiS [Natronospira sp. AB-CW4]
MRLEVNGETREFERELSIAELLEALEFTGRRVAVEHNGMIVPRSQHGQTRLEDGDRLEIVQAVGGG